MSSKTLDAKSSMMSLRKGAAYLGIGLNSIYEYVRAGYIPVVSLPGRAQKRVTREALDAFRDAHTGTVVRESEPPPREPSPTKRQLDELDAVFQRGR